MQPEERSFSTMTGAAIAMHEWFTSLINAGFTEQQALKLIAATMKGEPDSQ